MLLAVIEMWIGYGKADLLYKMLIFSDCRVLSFHSYFSTQSRKRFLPMLDAICIWISIRWGSIIVVLNLIQYLQYRFCDIVTLSTINLTVLYPLIQCTITVSGPHENLT